MWAAKQGLAALAPQWSDGPNANSSNAVLVAQMEAAAQKAGAVARRDGEVAKALPGGTQAGGKTGEAVYQLPFLAHATMEPINRTVHVTRDGCDVWTGTQVPTLAQGIAAKMAELPLKKVRIHNHYLGGGFGRRLDGRLRAPRAAGADRVLAYGQVVKWSTPVLSAHRSKAA